MIAGMWLACSREDARARALYRRHYSAAKNAQAFRRSGNFVGPGRPMVLLTPDCTAVFVWLKSTVPRLDGQDGVICTLFRNEGATLSSDLIREACDLAWARWPGERLFTYVDPSQVASAHPGYCFKRAGWRLVRDGDGAPRRSGRGLLLLELLPAWLQEAAS